MKGTKKEFSLEIQEDFIRELVEIVKKKFIQPTRFTVLKRFFVRSVFKKRFIKNL
jgi:hypothetical protein